MFNRSRLPRSPPILPRHVSDPASNTDGDAARSGVPSQFTRVSQSILRLNTKANFMTRACAFFHLTMFRFSVLVVYLVFGIVKPLILYIKPDNLKVAFILDLVFNIAANFITIIGWKQEDRAAIGQRVTQAPKAYTFRLSVFRVSVLVFYLVFGIVQLLFSYIKPDNLKVAFILGLVFNFAVNVITIIGWQQEDKAATGQRVTEAPIRDNEFILNPLSSRDDAVAEGSAVYPRDISQLHRRARVMSRNEDDDTMYASSVAASDYQSPAMPDGRSRIGDMSDNESSSSIQSQDSTHAEAFSSSPPIESNFSPPTSVTFSGPNFGNTNSEAEDQDDQLRKSKKRSALWKRSRKASSPALSTAQNAVSLPAEIDVPNHRLQPYNPAFDRDPAEDFMERSPAPKWHPSLPSSPPPVLLQPPPPLPPPYQKLALYVYQAGKVSINTNNAIKHDSEIHVFGSGQLDFNDPRDGNIEVDQVDTGRGGEAPVGKKIKGRRQAKRRRTP